MFARILLLALTLSGCTTDVAGPRTSHVPPIPPEEPLNDLELPGSLYDATGHHFSVFAGTDPSGDWSLHLRDALRFALIREREGGSFEIEVTSNGDRVTRLSIREGLPVARLECAEAERSYLHAANALILAAASPAAGRSHLARRRVALAARAFRGAWAAREGCHPAD